MAFETLIGAESLESLLASDSPALVLDASFDLGDPSAGERSFDEAHVPGSVYVHLDRDLCAAKTGRNGRHPLPERGVFARTAGRLGITPRTQVVTLDRQGGMYAARLWWMLRWLGHSQVAVLDGGLAAWTAGGGRLSSDRAEPVDAGPYPERPSIAGSVDAAMLAASLDRIALLDARSAERFRGDREPIDPVAGHIPGALNRFHAANLAPGGRFKPAAELRDEFVAALGPRSATDVVHSCGSGVTACHNLLAMEHAGLHGSRLYPGSWSEWSADPSRPIARGDPGA
ncbi:MAG: sulfurtransferase [Pseudomonadota bacterium]|nr:sulfurtransferase [Pseudomonadota bacterium]